MTIYILTFKSTASHDAEKRAGLNLFLKTMGRRYRLKCVNIEEKEVADAKDSAPKTTRKARRATKLYAGRLDKGARDSHEAFSLRP